MRQDRHRNSGTKKETVTATERQTERDREKDRERHRQKKTKSQRMAPPKNANLPSVQFTPHVI